MEQNTNGYRQELRKAYIDLAVGLEPNAFVTLTTNGQTKDQPNQKKTSAVGPPKALTWRYQGEPKISILSKTLDMSRLISKYLARIDRALLGREWSQVPPDQRTDGIFIIEHTDTNIHAHGLLRFPATKTYSLETLTREVWCRLTEAGDTNFQPINDVQACAEYCTKEMSSVFFNSDQVVLTRQSMAL